MRVVFQTMKAEVWFITLFIAYDPDDKELLFGFLKWGISIKIRRKSKIREL